MYQNNTSGWTPSGMSQPKATLNHTRSVTAGTPPPTTTMPPPIAVMPQPPAAMYAPPFIAPPECRFGEDNQSLVMGYVKMQKWDQVYETEAGLERGTIFPELDMPFEGEGACVR